MFKATLLNISLYILIKYLLFYILLMFKNDDYYFINPSIRNGDDLFFYLWLLLSIPVLCMIFFSAPIYYAFKIKKKVFFVLIILGYLIIEYLLYTYLASQSDLKNGLYNSMLSIFLLGIFFFKSIVAIGKNQK